MLFKNYTFVDPVLSRKVISCVDKWTGPVGVDYTVKEIIDTVCPGLYDMIDEKDYLRIGRAVRKKYNLNHYYIIGNSLNSTIISGIFPSGGDTKFGMWCDVITLWCVIVPMGFIGAFVLKLPVLAVAFILTLDEFVKIPAVYKHYMKYKWVKNITKGQCNE